MLNNAYFPSSINLSITPGQGHGVKYILVQRKDVNIYIMKIDDGSMKYMHINLMFKYIYF